jgi:hypothetical protein
MSGIEKSCGCVLCDLGNTPEMLDSKLSHFTWSRTIVYPCTSTTKGGYIIPDRTTFTRDVIRALRKSTKPA